MEGMKIRPCNLLKMERETGIEPATNSLEVRQPFDSVVVNWFSSVCQDSLKFTQFPLLRGCPRPGVVLSYADFSQLIAAGTGTSMPSEFQFLYQQRPHSLCNELFEQTFHFPHCGRIVLVAGHATSAAIAGASERSIMKQTGHRSFQMVRRYIRERNLFRENSTGKLGL